jgi:hypothetical protein
MSELAHALPLRSALPPAPSPIGPPPTPRGALNVGTQAGIVAAAIGLVAGVVALSHEVSFIQIYGRIVGWSAFLMFIVTLVQLFALRQARLLPRIDEEWTVPERRRPRKRRGTLPMHDRRFKHGRLGYLLLPLAVLAIDLPTTKATTIALAIVACIVWLWSRTVESELVDLQADMLAHSAAARAEKLEAARQQRAAGIEHPHDPVLCPRIDPHLAAARRKAVKRARRALVGVTTLASAITILAAWSSMVSAITLVSCAAQRTWSQPHHKPEKLSESPAGSSSSTSKTSGKIGTGSSDGSGGSVGSATPAVETSCPAIPDPDGAPTAKVRELEMLFSSNGSPGRGAAGCPVAVMEQATSAGTLYWTRGEEGSAIKSVAMVPPDYKNTIVIGPAVGPTEELIVEGDDLHGPETFPRYYAGPGEYYLLYVGADETPAMLVRERVDAEALYLLRPSAVTAWISTVREHGIWLWPSLSTSHGGEEIFTLHGTDERHTLETIRYDLSTREATRPLVEEPYFPEVGSLTPQQIAYWTPAAEA